MTDDKNPRFPGRFGGGTGGSKTINPSGAKRKAVTVSLDQDLLEWLDSHGSRQRSQIINEAVAMYRAAQAAIHKVK